MNTLKQFTAVAVFLFLFLVDVWFHVEVQWYGLLFCLMLLLFGVKPSRHMAKLIAAIAYFLRETNRSHDKKCVR